MKTLDQHFADWESHVFGFGYGTGEAHTIPALMKFMSLCVEHDTGRAYDYQKLEEELTPTVAWLLINRLCGYGVDIIEYGTSPRCGWLTSQGEALRDYLAGKTLDQVVAIVCSRTEHDEECYPDVCNCMSEEPCHNPFWIEKHGRRTFFAEQSAYGE